MKGGILAFLKLTDATVYYTKFGVWEVHTQQTTTGYETCLAKDGKIVESCTTPYARFHDADEALNAVADMHDSWFQRIRRLSGGA